MDKLEAPANAREIKDIQDQSYEEWICGRLAPVARRAALSGFLVLLGALGIDLAFSGLGPSPLLASLLGIGAVLTLLGAYLALRPLATTPRAMDLSLALALASQALVVAHNALQGHDRLNYVPFIVLFYMLSAMLVAPAIKIRSYLLGLGFNLAYLGLLVALSPHQVEEWFDLALVILTALGFLGQAVVSQNREARQHFQLARESAYRASTDSLSRLLNRRAFVEKAGQALRGHRHQDALGGRTSFLMLDIDHFKAVNDTWGHEAGDLVIRSLAQAIKESVRDTDLVGRLGGEEFGVLLPSLGPGEAGQIAERIRTTVEALSLDYRGREIRVTLSLGLSHGSPGELESLMREADRCLYEAKRSGRNRLVAQAHD